LSPRSLHRIADLGVGSSGTCDRSRGGALRRLVSAVHRLLDNHLERRAEVVQRHPRSTADQPVTKAKRALEQYEILLEEVKSSKEAYLLEFVTSQHDEVRAWSAFAQGNNDEAVRLLRAVADRQDATGKEETEIPAREMLADMLLDMNRTQDALAEYEKSLKTDPHLWRVLSG